MLITVGWAALAAAFTFSIAMVGSQYDGTSTSEPELGSLNRD